MSGSVIPTPRRTLLDRLGPGMRVMFVGINPGMRSAATGHHFAGFSNRFWKLLFDAGLVPESMTAFDDHRLPDFGYGITNLVARATPGVSDLTAADYETGRRRLVAKIARYRPECVALVGVTLCRALFKLPAAAPVSLGLQPQRLGGVPVFVLPNPSGRNANFSYAEMLEAFRRLKQALDGRAEDRSRLQRDPAKTTNRRRAKEPG